MIDPHKNREIITEQDGDRSGKEAQVLGLQKLLRPQGTLGLFIRNGPADNAGTAPRTDFTTHVSAVMHEFAGAHPDWLTVIQLPSYAPDLNPCEDAWANMKNGLGNLVACTAGAAGRYRQDPAQAHPVPARAHQRIPHPDRTQS